MMILRNAVLIFFLALWCEASAALPIASVPSRQPIADQPTHYLHTKWGLLAEADASGQLTTTYGWNPQRDNGVAPLFARTPDAANPGQWRTVYYHNDHLGTPQRITDKSGAVIWAADYDAYGKAITRTTADAAKAITNNLRYPGQYWDAETGLHYNDRRYYDPETGRYLSSDPLGFEGGINLYTYAAAAPGRYTDPTGEAIPCMAANYVRCNIVCNIESAAGDAFMNCGEVNWAENAKDCLKSCIFAMLPIPDPCGKFGKLLSVVVGAFGGSGGGGENSFTGDTLVHVRDRQGKPALKPIADIKIGDEVLAWDEMAAHDGKLGKKTEEIKGKTGSSAQQISAIRYEKVSDLITSEKQQRLVHITLEGGKSITATDGHPFRTSEGWRDAILLKKGGKLLLKGSGEGDDDSAGGATIEDVRIETKTVRVYNLEVENLHTFFVGDEGYVVHNGFGSYTCHFKSGNKYHGKGDWNRAKKSAREKADKYKDELLFIDWTPANNDRDSFKDEHKRMMTDRDGHKSPNNYNRRASPGRRFLK